MRHPLILAAALLLMAGPVHADDVSQLKQQVQALQQSVRSMQQASLEKGIQSAEGAANVERVRREFQTLQGSYEAVQFELKNQRETQGRFQQDVDARLRAIEDKLSIISKQKVAETGAPWMEPTAAAGEANLYQKGLSQVRDGHYTEAAASFREFLQKYPKTSFAANAQYWVAECYYAQKDYQRAIKEYQALITTYPKSDKVSMAKLRQGLGFADLGMSNEATLFLQKLVKDHPGTPEAEKAENRLKLMTSRVSAAITPSAVPSPKSVDSIPLAPGAVPRKPDLAPLPQNETSSGNSKH